MPAPFKVHEKISAADGDVSAPFNIGPKGVMVSCTGFGVGGDTIGTMTLEGCNDPDKAADKDTAWPKVDEVVNAAIGILKFGNGETRYMRYRFRFLKQTDAASADFHIHRWRA